MIAPTQQPGTSSASGWRRLFTPAWLLALPGAWVILCFVIVEQVSEWAACPGSTGLHYAACPPGAAGMFADAVRTTVLWTIFGSFIGIGAIPPIYTIYFVLWKLASRASARFAPGASRPKAMAVGFAVVLAGIVVVSTILTALTTAKSFADLATGLIGLAFMVLVFYLLYLLLLFCRRLWLAAFRR